MANKNQESSGEIQLGAVQLQILQVLWDKGKASAREITDEMNRHSDTAHSTVQTLLRQLESKGVVSHESLDRAFVFFPTVNRKNVAKCEIRQLTERLFGGSPCRLMTYLLKQESIPREELEAMKRLIEEKEKEAC